jgi:PAS domain S-box-containing protein
MERGWSFRLLLIQLALAAVYFISAKFGLSLAVPSIADQVSAVWPPTGIALAAVLIFGYRVWPGIAVGAFLVNFQTNEAFGTALGIAFGNTSEALLGAYLLWRFVDFEPSLRRLKDVVGLAIYGAGAGTIVSATVGVASLYLGGHVNWDRFHSSGAVHWGQLFNAWQVWWMGDAMGALIVTPLLLTWYSKSPNYGHPLEVVLLFLTICVTGTLIYSEMFNQSIHFRFIVFPLAIWAAARLGQRLTAAAVVLVATFAVWGAMTNAQAFAGDTLSERLILLQTFMGVVSLTALSLGAVTAERRHAVEATKLAEEGLRKANDNLENRIQARTHALLREITERKNAEQKLVASRQELQNYIDNLSTYNVKVAPDGKFLLVGRAAQIASGYPLEELMKINFLEGPWFAYDKDVQARAKAAFAQAVAGAHVNYDERVRAAGDHMLTVNFNLAPIRAADGSVEYVVAEGRDITALKAAEGELREAYAKLDERVRLRTADLERANTELVKAKQELEAASRAKDEFLAVCSHELRTPLTPILGWTRILRSHPINDPTFKRAMEVIERNVRAQGKLIEDLLDISRIITGKLRLNMRDMDVNEVIQSAIETVKPAAQAKDIALSIKLEKAAGVTVGDADRLQQVFWNLLSNAVKFTRKQGRISVELKRADTMLEITVSDNGEGISPEFLPHIFNRFAQADSTTTRSHGGMGLGLAIVRHIVELHGGRVKAESAGKGEGAVFTVSLPIVATRTESGDTGPSYRTPASGSMAVPYLKNVQVLVVDDEADTCEFVAAALEQWGAKVATVPTAHDAIAALDKLKPDVLISDIGMPGEDGFALIRRVRTRDRSQGGRIPAIALTAYTRAEDRARILSEGFQMHVPKPVDPVELATAVSHVTQTQVEY